MRVSTQEFEASEDTSRQVPFVKVGAFVRVSVEGWSILGEG